MLLVGYNFIIYYREGRINLANTPSRRPDYKDKNKVKPIDRLLLTLHQKLAVLPKEVAVGAISV
jgi:hypothetical protein